MFIAAAEILADLVTDDDLKKGRLFPSLTKIRDISCQIALSVAKVAFDNNLTDISQPENLQKHVQGSMFEPIYRNYI